MGPESNCPPDWWFVLGHLPWLVSFRFRDSPMMNREWLPFIQLQVNTAYYISVGRFCVGRGSR